MANGSSIPEMDELALLAALAAPDRAPRPELRARLMKSVEAKKASVGTIVRPEDTAWQNFAPGVDIRPLLGRKTMLVRMAAGASLPEHEHHYGEQCLVLEGSVRSDDVEAHAGDFTYMPAGSLHGQLYSETGCLLLITYT